MERQNRVLREANDIVKKQNKREKRRRRLVQARNAVAMVAIAATVTASEYAITSQMPHQQEAPSCFALKLDYCPWPLATPTMTPIHSDSHHTPVPEHDEANPHVRFVK